MHRFVLRDTDMNDLGDVLLATPVWRLGDVFTTGDRRKYRIHGMLEPPLEKPELRLAGVWVVEPVEQLRRA